MARVRHSLRILQVNTADQGGGAEGSARNLLQAYRDRGHISWLAVGHKYTDDPDIIPVPQRPTPTFWAPSSLKLHQRLAHLEGRVRGVGRLRALLHGLSRGGALIERRRGREDFDYLGSWQLLELPPQRPDLIHAHNLHGGYFDLRLLPWLSHQVPVILNLRDAWLLSGHCAHSLGCLRWKVGCGSCPDLTIYPSVRRDATAYNWQRKRDIYARSHLYVSTPSNWLMNMVQHSMLQCVESRCIPNGIDLNIFHPRDRIAARAELGLPLEPKIVMFAAHSVRRNIWKDYSMMEAAVRLVAQSSEDIELLFLCLGEDAEDQLLDGARISFVGFERDLRRMALHYQASDIYIHAAKAEVFGKTVTEALACGVPVVVTATGGIPEQVKDGSTGFLVPPGDAVFMATKIKQLLANRELHHRFSGAAAEDVRRRFSLQHQADRFLEWYQEILQNWSPADTRARSSRN